jgi:hypothetical protein
VEELKTLQLLEPLESHEPPEVLPPLDTPLTERDERGIRKELRRQISRMEGELGRLFAAAFPYEGIEFRVEAPVSWGPQLLEIGELEALRDDLADRLSEARGDLAAIADSEQAHRELIERMVADPAAYKWVRVSNVAIGEPGCRNWHARPRWGVIGYLMNWWRVKLSSGCPLAQGHG